MRVRTTSLMGSEGANLADIAPDMRSAYLRHIETLAIPTLVDYDPNFRVATSLVKIHHHHAAD